MNIKVSVILPVYNSEKYLEKCLKSICSQSLSDIEIICVNNCSTDLSYEILQNFSDKDKRIRLVNKMNEGKGSACNTGLNLAHGEYVSIINPECILDKKMYERLFKLAKTTEADIVKSAYYAPNSSPDRAKEKVDFAEKFNIPGWFFRIGECPFFLSSETSIFSALYRKTFLNSASIRFVEVKGKGFTDYPFCVETYLLAQKIVYTHSAYCTSVESLKPSFSELREVVALFERADEISEILSRQKVKDRNILANVYKKELEFITYALQFSFGDDFENVFEGRDFVEFFKRFDFKNIPYEIQLRMEKMLCRTDETVIRDNPCINSYERKLYMFLNTIIQKGIKSQRL